MRTFGLLHLIVAAGVSGGVGGTAGQLPVPYGYFVGQQAQQNHPGQAPPGADDWSCRPSAEHPEPVVLLHGFGATETSRWQTMAPLLANAGYCVFGLTYGRNGLGDVGGLAGVEDSAAEVGAFVDRVREATGSDRVDLVGHSVGGVVAFYYAIHDGAQHVARVVTLGSPLHGTTGDGIGALLTQLPGAAQTCVQCAELTPGSPFMAGFDPDPNLAPDVRFTGIVSTFDEIATPYTTGEFDPAPNVTDIVLQDGCPTDYADHFTLPSEPVTAQHIVNALDPDHATPVQCSVVLPFAG